jgi:hypothetical protein
MKALSSLLFLAILSGCESAHAYGPADARKLGEFTSIAATGPFDVNVTVGRDAAVSVACSDGDVRRVSTKVENGTLTIEDTKTSIWPKRSTCTVTVSTPKLTAMKSVGSGDATIEGSGEGLTTITRIGSGETVVAEARAERLTLTLRGSGGLRVDAIAANEIGAEAMGSGTLRVAGKSKGVSITVHGSGQAEAKSLEAESANVKLFGSGDVAAYASQRADVETNGSGDVVIYGKPSARNAQSNGSGRIRFSS